MDEEANDRGVISVAPEVIKLKGGMRRNSTGKTISTGSLFLSNCDGKILPRYLRTSMGSCHDFCKYGRKEVSEADRKHPFQRRSLPNNIIQDKEHNQVESVNLDERRKKPVIKLRASSQLKFEYSDALKINMKKAPSPAKESGFFEKKVNIKLGTPSPTHKSIVSAEHKILQTSPENEVNQVESLNPDDTKKGHVIKLKTTLQPKISPNKSKVIKQQETSPANEIDAVGVPDIAGKHTASHVKKSAASVKPNVIKQKALPSVKKSIPSVKFQVLKQKASSPLKRIDLSAKPSISLKRKTTVVKPISVLNPLQSLTSQRNQEARIIKTLGISKIGEKKVLKPPSTSLSPKTPVNGVLSMKPRKYRNAKHVSPMKNQVKVRKTEHDSDDIKEKMLYAIEPKSENFELDPMQQNSENYQSYPSISYLEEEIKESESAFSDASESIYEEEVTECKVKLSKGEDKRRHRRTATVHPIESFSKPHKLRFRRGKVVDLLPENIGPRRLRFRKARGVVGENPNGIGEVGTGNVRRGELGGSVSNDLGSEAQAVLLRHQDMQGKKDSQGLFNHVIEETATKLIETRKSKVKALVGAFENLISLQESRPASTV